MGWPVGPITFDSNMSGGIGGKPQVSPTTMNAITFTVVGVPQPKGSARAFLPKGWTRPIVTTDNPKNKGWQQLVAEAACQALSQSQFYTTGPVRLTAVFFLPRPQKPKREAHITKPDLDKLLRSVKDALSRVLWHDDSQVTEVHAIKRYAPKGQSPCVTIRVVALDAEQPSLVQKEA